MQIKLHDLDTRLARIERVVANQSLLQLANDVESLRTDVRALHNDVDELSHNLEANRKQQRDLYADLDQRMKSLEARGGSRERCCRGGRRRRGRRRRGRRGVECAGIAGLRYGRLSSGVRTAEGQPVRPGHHGISELPRVLSKQSAGGKRTVLARRSLLREQILPGSVGRLSARGGPSTRNRASCPTRCSRSATATTSSSSGSAARDVLSQVASQYSDTPAGNLAQAAPGENGRREALSGEYA